MDFLSLGICSVIWGTTWLVLKLQLGSASPVASIFYRFVLSGALMFPISAWQGDRLGLTRREHGLAAGQGLAVFCCGYLFVYMAESHAPSAVVAVAFALMALVNTAMFRLVLKQKAHRAAWLGAGLGAMGVACLSYGQIANSPVRGDLLVGVGLTVMSVIFNAFGNLAARLSQTSRTPVATMTGWSMLYGSTALLVFGLATHTSFQVPMTLAWWAPFLYLSLVGSVAAFLIYYSLANRRGFTVASYTSVLTPPIAMLVSSLFEKVRWDWTALVGLIFIMMGQVLIVRQGRLTAAAAVAKD
jgi:drug/metabolite transporter (DMT)-like permease